MGLFDTRATMAGKGGQSGAEGNKRGPKKIKGPRNRQSRMMRGALVKQGL